MYRNLGISVRDAYQGSRLKGSVRLQFEARGVIKSVGQQVPREDSGVSVLSLLSRLLRGGRHLHSWRYSHSCEVAERRLEEFAAATFSSVVQVAAAIVISRRLATSKRAKRCMRRGG